MAVGDPVNITSNVTFTFQPAAGVSVMVTQFVTVNYDSKVYGLGDLNTSTDPFGWNADTGNDWTTTEFRNIMGVSNYKFFLTNTGYISFTMAAGRYCGFSGIQIQ